MNDLNDLRECYSGDIGEQLNALEDMTMRVGRLGLHAAINAGIPKAALTKIVTGLLARRASGKIEDFNTNSFDEFTNMLRNIIADSGLSESKLAYTWTYLYKQNDGSNIYHSKSLFSILRSLGEVSEEGLICIIHSLRQLED